MQQRFIKAGLILFGHDEHIEVVMEFRLGLVFGDMRTILAHVQAAFGVLLVAILDRAGERHHDIHAGIALFGNIALHLMEIAHSSQAGGRDHHHFTLASNGMRRGGQEGFHNDLRLLRNVIGVQLLKPADDLCRAAGRNLGIIRDGLGNFEAGMVGHVVLQHIHDEAFLNGLLHGIDMERIEASVHILGAEHFQRLRLGRGGKGKKAQVLVLAMHQHFLQQLVLTVDFILGLAFDFGIFAQGGFGIGQSGFELAGG